MYDFVFVTVYSRDLWDINGKTTISISVTEPLMKGHLS
jgi:hypothetical protein